MNVIEKLLASKSQYLCINGTASLPEFIITAFKIKTVFSYIYPLNCTEITGRYYLSYQKMKQERRKKKNIKPIALIKLNNKEELYPSALNYLAKCMRTRQPLPRNG